MNLSTLQKTSKKTVDLVNETKSAIDQIDVDTRIPLHIEFTATDECNCRCSYCFENCKPREKLREEVQRKMLELAVDICKRFDENEHPFLIFSFWGGEPFMNYSFVKQLLDSTKEYSFTKYHIYTNGLLTKQLDDFLKYSSDANLQSRLTMQFSYDGEPHNTLKRHNDGKTTIENAKKFIQSGFNVRFKATLSYDMIHKMPEIWESYKQLYDDIGDCVSYGPTIDMANDDMSYIDVWKLAIKEVIKKEKNFIISNGRPLLSWLDDNQKRSCCIDYSVHLHSDGNAYICHGCPYTSNLESMRYGSFMEISSLVPYLRRNSANMIKNEKCKNCGASYCAICHAMHLHKDNISQNVKEWYINRSENGLRCLYYQYFSYMASALKYVLIKK